MLAIVSLASAQPPPPATLAPTLPALEVPPLPAAASSQVPLERALALKEAIAIALYAQPQVALARYSAEALTSVCARLPADSTRRSASAGSTLGPGLAGAGAE